MSLDYDRLRSLPSVEVPTFIECAGNGRSFYATQHGTAAGGAQWGLGAVGVGNWRGVPLAEVLERAGLLPGAVDASRPPAYRRVRSRAYGSWVSESTLSA